MSLKETFRYWIPVIFAFSVIFFLSSISAATYLSWGLPFESKVLHKLAHFCLYSLLGFTLTRALTAKMRNQHIPWSTYKPYFVWITLIGFLYGATDEFHQMFVPGRGPHPADVLLDGISTFVGCLMTIPYRSFTASSTGSEKRADYSK